MRKVICLFLFGIFPLLAVAASEDAPGRVARLSLTQGEVSLAPAGTDEWADAVINRPLTTGDRIWVDKEGRAELQAGAATIHLDQNSGFAFEQLDDDAMRMNLMDGAVTVRISRKLESEVIEVATPNATVALLHPGEYHIEVNEAGDRTIVKARSGEAAVTGEKDSYVVRSGESGMFSGTKNLAADISSLGARTAFESWANDRSQREERSVSARYVSRDVVGYEELDEAGDWISEPEYGYVWIPRHVHAGWAPYRDGRWAWVSPWGWTWIDDARWGFAPSHYGRWAYARSRWCWVPGPRHVRPIYAPALVAWVGSPGINVSIGIGSGVGWFPLGPREIYVPGYWHSRRYMHNVNVTNTVIINNNYINDAYRGRRDRLDYRYRNEPRAVTLVSRDSFVAGRPVGGHVAVNARDLRNWRYDVRPPAIAPGRDSVLASNVRTPTRDLNARFSRAERAESSRGRAAGFAGRVPFDAERQAIEANGGRPVTRSQLFTSNPRNPVSSRSTRSSNEGTVKDGMTRRLPGMERSDRQAPDRNSQLNSLGTAPELSGERGRGARPTRGSGVVQDSMNQTPQWRGDDRRNEVPSTRSRTEPQVGSSDTFTNPSRGSSFTPHTQEDILERSRRDTARREQLMNSQPPVVTESERRNSWRPERNRDRGTNAIPAPTFNDLPREPRQDRLSRGVERQPEARQIERQPESRIQAAPAQESARRESSPRQSVPEHSSRSGDRSGNVRGNRTRDN